MNRRAFLKAIATIGAAAAIPPALLPKWKHDEPTERLDSYGFRIFAHFNLLADNPYRLGVITSIS